MKNQKQGAASTSKKQREDETTREDISRTDQRQIERPSFQRWTEWGTYNRSKYMEDSTQRKQKLFR